MRVTDNDSALQQFLARMTGYSLTGDVSEHALFFAHGTGANGKSSFSDAISGLMGSYHATAPIETFTHSSSDRHPTELAMLHGARLVTANETEEGRRWAESRIKSLTGGDRVAARFMRQDFFEFNPRFKLLISGNHKPGLRSVDEAIRRRFNLIPFNVTIPAQERDPELPARLRDEWPGILTWAITGCLEWQQSKLSPPAVVREATATYFDSEDAIAAWLESSCEGVPDHWENRSVLFASWRRWAEGNGEAVGSAKSFTAKMESRGLRAARFPQGRGFYGYRVRNGFASNEG